MSRGFIKLGAFICIGLVFYVCYRSLHNKWKSSLAGDYYQFWVVGQAVKVMPVTGWYRPDECAAIRKFFYERAMKGQSYLEKNCFRVNRRLSLLGHRFFMRYSPGYQPGISTAILMFSD